MHLWSKTVPSERLVGWLAKVEGSIPPERLAVVTPAYSDRPRLEAYMETAAEAAALARVFGGRTAEVRPEDWLPDPATDPGKPLSFGGRLLVTGRPEELAPLRAAHPGRPVLCIPAAMAFGSGEHATTAMCLRFLSEVSRSLGTVGLPWRLLDLGTGSGVLALAARLFGAAEVGGFDNDPHAVRTAKENARFNGVARFRSRRADLLRAPWPWQPDGGWNVIAANLFSELLIAALPQIAASLVGGGQLIASGVLANQATDVEAALTKTGFVLDTKRRRGKWVAFLARKAVA